MNGKTVIVTGATAGIGEACALEIARRGAKVIGISRSPEKCARVEAEIRKQAGQQDIHFYPADLSSMSEVRRIAGFLRQQLDRLDVLVNNAGGIFLKREETVDGYEKTFALNHLNYFLLTHELLDLLKDSAPSRVVNVSSSSNYKGKIHLDNLQLKRGYRGFRAYQQSKLANILFTKELARRLEGTGVTINALHPGLVRTNIARDNGFLARLVQTAFVSKARTPEEGARTMVYLACSPEVEGITGKFFFDDAEVPPNVLANDSEIARRLWDESARMTGIAKTA